MSMRTLCVDIKHKLGDLYTNLPNVNIHSSLQDEDGRVVASSVGAIMGIHVAAILVSFLTVASVTAIIVMEVDVFALQDVKYPAGVPASFGVFAFIVAAASNNKEMLIAKA